MSLLRTRWAAIGAAVAISLGAGGIGIVSATVSSGDRTVFVPITPCRIMDTRPAFAVGPKTSPLGPEEVYTVEAHGTRGRCTLPNDASGLVLNVTATDATLPTFLAIWGDGARPNSSALNPSPGQPPTPNAVTTDLTSDGQFKIFNKQGNVNVFVDVVGYYANHNHDDRYYTKAQTNTQINNAIAAAPWSIYIAPSDMENVGATFPGVTLASGISALGMAFNDGVFGRRGLRLPTPRQLPGRNRRPDRHVLDRDSGFGAPVFPCDSVWWSNGPYANPDRCGHVLPRHDLGDPATDSTAPRPA